MIPLRLKLAGFLSYREPVELDFTRFDLACISGANGAGKSSLMDAITWALFGNARRRDEAVINTHPEIKAAEVNFQFAYEGNIYRIQRTLPRGKSQDLQFQIFKGSPLADQPQAGDWRPLTESTNRETQARIERTLRLDYETFINASFFLQGKADQFTQQRPPERKRILGSILGLEIWERYKDEAAEQRKRVESQVEVKQGLLNEILSELEEEDDRRVRLAVLESDLARLTESRQAQASALEDLRRVIAALNEQRRLVEALQRQAQASRRRLEELQSRQATRQAELVANEALLARRVEIEAAHAAWLETRRELAAWDETARRFHDHEIRRQQPLQDIRAQEAALQSELAVLHTRLATLEAELKSRPDLEARYQAAEQALKALESELGERASLEHDLAEARQHQADARAENPLLKRDMDELKARIHRLQALDATANCPFCGQPLDSAQRQRLIEELSAQGTAMGDRFRANKALIDNANALVSGLEARLKDLVRKEQARLTLTSDLTRLSSQLESLANHANAWQTQDAPRLGELTRTLAEQDYAHAARQNLAAVDASLKEIGYDAATHDAIRQRELQTRSIEGELRELEMAGAVHANLQRELAELEAQATQLGSEAASQDEEFSQAAAALAAAQAQAPDLVSAEARLYQIQEQENRLRLEVGAAHQKVLVLEDLKRRQAQLAAEVEDLARLVTRYKQLERAFGKSGVPALLIEQALPQIEEKANELLDRLSGGAMSVRFVTQAAYKDPKRGDLKETLDIQISDASGTRDYEMYSGGEAFRVNFAIRLALSEVLAARAGARLQMLVVDEGFGSQDSQGRQRLVEAINLVRPDFAKILIITHIDELKDAFPTRIEVIKTEIGSTLQII
jgi:exonuclease SbcC